MTINGHIKIIYLTCCSLFLVNKIVIRPLVYEEKVSHLVQLISLSIPNFFEAVLGTITVIVLLLVLKFKKVPLIQEIIDQKLKIYAILFAAIFVITQEIKLHNLGGRNVYDFNDLVASILGLFFIGFVILRNPIVRFQNMKL